MERKEVRDDGNLTLDAWIEKHVRKQKTIRKQPGAYGMKHIVERDIGYYVSEPEFIDAMTRAGYKCVDKHFNCILVSRDKNLQYDRQPAKVWGLSEHAYTLWRRHNPEEPERTMVNDRYSLDNAY